MVSWPFKVCSFPGKLLFLDPAITLMRIKRMAACCVLLVRGPEHSKQHVHSLLRKVLDNGVTSNEYWRIVDCTDDLSWALFYYAGAAAAAGQAYSGAVLATPDGNWPSKDQEERLCAALDAAGIKLWELYRVDNKSCGGAPLDISSKDLSPQGVETSLFES